MRSWVHCSGLLGAEALMGSARRPMEAGIASSNSVMHSHSMNIRLAYRMSSMSMGSGVF